MIKNLLSFLLICAGFSANSQYCLTGGPSNINDSNLELLSLTGTSGGLNYTGCPGILGVEEILGQTTTLNAGDAYSITLKFGTCGGNYGSVAEAWIDYNDNNVFEASESILTWAGTPPMVATNFIFSVPAGALTGQSRLRVVQVEGLSAPLDPCVAFTWGSITDFNIEIQNGVDCSGYIGDEAADARIVPAIPYSETHNTSICYGNQNPAYSSPDVFYLVLPGALNSLNISLCGSAFDTYLSVRDKYGNILSMNDDNANCASTSSELNISTVGFDSLYVIVEGWGMAMGSYTINIGEGPLGVNELSNDPFVIYPNPTSNSFQLEGNYSGDIQILNTEGRVVLSSNITTKETVDVSSLTSGFYIVRLKSDLHIYDKKLIIE